MHARVLTLLISTFVVAACGGSAFTGSTDGDASAGDATGDALVGQECSRDVDCAAGICEFKIADACSKPGHCIPKPAPGPTCNSYSPACTCDGDTINVACTDYPDGYAGRAIAHTGACADAASGDGSVGVSDGSMGDGSVGKDASRGMGDGGVTSDGAVGGFACGSTTCSTDDVCVVTETSGGPCLLPLDGGMCPAGFKLNGGCCVSLSEGKTYACEAKPTCTAMALTCTCAGSLCGSGCFCTGTPSETEVDCQCDAP